MPFYAVLDTCVLVPMPLRDTLLLLAADELFVPKWAARSIASMQMVLVEELGRTEEQAGRVGDALRNYFEDAEVPADRIAALEPAMGNPEGDRYVLAAAVASGAELIVTDNLKHFTSADCDPHGVQAVSPDDFLLDLLAHHPQAVVEAIERQAAQLRRPPMTMEDILERLAGASPGTPRFVAAVRSLREG